MEEGQSEQMDAQTWRILTPATSANLGPGFDCIGLALHLNNELGVEILPPGSKSSLHVLGEGQEINTGMDNLIYQSYLTGCRHLGISPKPVALTALNRIPFARGLGSSSAAIIAGLTVAQIVSDFAFSKAEFADLAVACDGHPDNALPCLFGGVVVASQENGQLIYECLPALTQMALHVLIPNYELKTSLAREALPAQFQLSDVVFNLGHLGLLVAAIMKDDLKLLGKAMRDRLHQPYRMELMPGMQMVEEEAYRLGAEAVAISGAGSTVLIISKPGYDFSALPIQLEKQGIKAKLLELSADHKGTQCFKDGMEISLWR